MTDGQGKIPGWVRKKSRVCRHGAEKGCLWENRPGKTERNEPNKDNLRSITQKVNVLKANSEENTSLSGLS
ncbi:hypothetical protein DESC_780340 [Desulfosarcina cetonica]|nr:hypothetical protein DESC_780340 [Desulfosarcina cetonica]